MNSASVTGGAALPPAQSCLPEPQSPVTHVNLPLLSVDFAAATQKNTYCFLPVGVAREVLRQVYGPLPCSRTGATDKHVALAIINGCAQPLI